MCEELFLTGRFTTPACQGSCPPVTAWSAACHGCSAWFGRGSGGGFAGQAVAGTEELGCSAVALVDGQGPVGVVPAGVGVVLGEQVGAGGVGDDVLEVVLLGAANVCEVPERERGVWVKAWTRPWRRRESEKEKRVPAYRTIHAESSVYDARRVEDISQLRETMRAAREWLGRQELTLSHLSVAKLAS